MRVAGRVSGAVTAPAEEQRHQHSDQQQQRPHQQQQQSAAPPKGGGGVGQHQRNTSATRSRSSSSRRRRGESDASGQPSNNNVVSAPITTTTTTAAAATTTATKTAAPAFRISSASMQQQQQQKQQLHQQPPQQQQQLTNNIILLRGARNENGQIVIQNKHDIISFINEQQQHGKSTVAATLTQLPTTTTVARKSIQTATALTPALSSLSSSLSSSCISLVANNSNGSGAGSCAKDASSGSTPSNTILLQTPINASQLESVLLQTANLKKQSAATPNLTAGLSLAQERQYLFKTASRSLSTDSNRMGHTDSSSSSGGGSKAPFVLQTLKRLEKSQSILVIRNSSTSSASVSSACSSSSTSSLSASSVSNIAHASTSTSADRKSVTPSPSSLLLPAGSTSSSASSSVPLSTSLSTTQTASLSLSLGSSAAPTLTPTTVCVSTNTQTGALSFTRATKSQQTTTKLGNVALNRTTLAATSNNNNNTAIVPTTTKAPVATTTTTYLRLTNAITTVFANNNNNNHGGNINNNNKNASGSNSHKGHNSNGVVAVSANNNNGNKIANISNNNGMRNALSGAVETQTQLSLADVQLKQERNTASVVSATGNGGTTSTLHHHHHPHQQHLQLQQQHLQLQQQQQQQQHQANAPLGNDGEPIKLPDNLESLPRADSFPSQRHRWNTNEEIAAILISFEKHSEWQSKEVRTRPKSGSLLLYSRKKVRYRRDGYCWKKRKDGKTTREDHMKLKVQGTECIYGCYVHSAILPTFHRRCYWLLQNPDIVLVHYLNVPYPDDNKMAVIAPSITLWGDKKEWTKDELVSQLKPMLSTVTSDDDSDSGNDIEISTAETVESIVCQLMEKQRLSRQAALVKQLDCGCGDASCADGKTCSHPVMRRPSLLKSVSEKRVSLSESYSQSSSGTPNVVVGQKLYSRWSERRMRDANADAHHHHQYAQQQQQQQHHHQTLPQETAIKFQIIPPNNEQQHSAYQQHFRLHGHSSNNNNNSGNSNAHQLISTRSNLMLQQQQQQQHQQQQQQSNFNQTSSTVSSSNHSNQLNLQRFVANQSSNSNNNNNTNSSNNNSQINHRLQIAKTTITPSSAAATTSTGEHGMGTANEAELIGNPNHMSTNSNVHNLNRNIHNNHNHSGNNSNSGNNCSQLTLTPQQAQQQQAHQQNVINNNGNANFNFSQQQQQQQQMNTSSSAAHTTSTQQQQQQEFYKLQPKQATNDIKMSVSQSQSHHPQAQQQHQLQLQTTTRATLSTVEPMCMSPEHHPSAPLVTPVSLSSTPNSNNNYNNNDILQQQQHLTSSPSMSTTSSASLSVPPSSLSSSPASMASVSALASTSASTTAAAAAATQSSSQSFMDDNVAHHKQSVCSGVDAAHAALDENLISAHATPMGEIDDVDANNADAVEVSSGGDIKQIIDTSNHNNGNGNNQATEYNNKNNTSDGCANIGASSDSATTDNVQQQQQHPLQPQQQQEQNCDAAQQPQQQAHNTHAIDFTTMDVTNGGACQADGQHQIAEHSAHELHDSLSFLNETLDLSQEDIQRTLIANLPFGTTDGKGAAESHVMNSIDFLSGTQSDDEILVPGVSCDGDDEDADDVFANLDAFDMLVEFPELDLDDKEALSHTVLDQQEQQPQQQPQSQQQQHQTLDETASITTTTLVVAGGQLNEVSSTHVDGLQHAQQYDKKLLSICDFSPEWSYTEGGVKVLVAGPWTADATYTVLFDGQPVPTELVQEGVLRCYSPAHDVGFASLQVSSDGFIISNAAMFEYKLPLCQEAPFDTASNDCLYKFTLLNRLLSIEEKMQVKTEAVNSLFEQQSLFLQTNFEEKLVNYCQHLKKRAWLVNSGNSWCGGYKGMSLLHLAAALGYTKLVCAMLNWRAENPNIVLETEMDALSQDVHGYTPMAWACARGHMDVANVLYKWNHNALKIKNHAQQTPMDIAHCKGHKTLLSEIYRLEHERHKQSRNDSLGSLSLGINKYSLNDINSKSANVNEHLFDVKDNENVFNTYDALDVQRSHDGVFLRPVAIASNQSPPNSSRFSKRSSVDSGINMDIRTKPGKSFKDITRLQSFEAHDNFNLAVESSLDVLTGGNTTNSLLSPSRKMDFALCEVSTGDSSPLPDKDHDDTSTINNDDITDVTINTETDGIVGDSDAKVLTLAEHIIAAMPERIKNEADELMVLGSPLTEPLNTDSPGLNNGFMDPLDSLPNTHFESFDFNDHSYRYHEVGTPCSSLSPASSGPLQSPASYSILGADLSVSSPSPPPSTKQLTEFLHASSNHQYPFEADFSKLTLTDTEQRELYEAAKCIQKAYRSYKGRQKLEEQNKERTAAIVIQNYYRRYKQYAYYRQMTNAALVIQHGYRSYCRNKRFKKSQSSTSTGIELSNGDSQSSPNSQCLSSFYDHFKHDQQHHEFNSQPSTPKETSPSGPLKRTYSQSTQNQAARKIQQFMRQSRIKLQRERAEKEKLVHQRRAEYLQSLQYQGQQEIVCQPERSELGTIELAKPTNNTFAFNMHPH